ncbi:4'-phosphopantetheinyl transferase superfamily protein [Xenorhabdus sp. 12]|uniref:Enterobactin synthase component D n=1 Tax=Xenorhabdus santafensis TaxID=2582833 RepID=A0ABU4S7Q6_9GAMM|nr:4'-phosphopantetheinyl transferase superfamily protein [Xenorhabdus sp. 12]MDX7986631.1 4'-phosphopantetheinyl transferase superfamily protein [Xenorhabdus sp. 12]
MKKITFTSVQTSSANDPFFTDLQTGSLPEYPDVQVMLAYFSQTFYRDTLFDEHGIAFPVNLQNAVNKRRSEYLAARYCTQQVLNHLNYPHFQVANAKDRSPIWPDNICGSISHSTNCAIAFAASCEHYRIIGIDIEQEIKTDTIENVSASIINDTEKALLAACSLPFGQAFTLAFSIKESLFKALYPHVKCFFDFHAAEITSIDCSSHTVSIKLLKTLSEQYQVGSLLHGTFVFMPQQQVLTYIVE